MTQDLFLGTAILGDCLDEMTAIKDKSVDMILCDLPYGTTACSWDTIINFQDLWTHYQRIIKPNSAIVLTASQPFTSALVMSNPKIFKYEWIWQKNNGSNFASVKYQPMKEHESVLIFCKESTNYSPIMQERAEGGKSRQKYKDIHKGDEGKRQVYNGISQIGITHRTLDRVPGSIQKFNVERGLHPTQKPVALFEYLIKTYTNTGDLVLDNCAGSFTTAIACINTGRRYICIEKDENYYNLGVDRINKEVDFL